MIIQKMKPTTNSKKFSIITASEARAGTLMTPTQQCLKRIELDIIKNMHKGYDSFIVNYTITEEAFSYLRCHGYRVEECYDEKREMHYGTYISWKE